MTTLLPGVSARGLALDTSTVHAIGRTLAGLDEALAQVQADLPERPTNWDITTVGEVLTELIPPTVTAGNDDHRAWRDVVERFVGDHLPELATLPTQIIHNDLNGSNLLVDTGTHRVTGLFDFGDVVVAPRVVDLAVAAAYLVDGSSADTYVDSLGAMIAGYRSVAPVTARELELIPEIMKARYAMALLLNSARADTSEDAAYIQYVHRNTATSRAKLALLTELPMKGLA
jgi:hydroxylysine kinase